MNGKTISCKDKYYAEDLTNEDTPVPSAVRAILSSTDTWVTPWERPEMSSYDDDADRQKLWLVIQDSEDIALHLEGKKLHDILECTLDPLETDEFGAGACLYHGHVCVIAYKKGNEMAFDILHPADDAHLCQKGCPSGFSVPWDFNTLETSKRVRQLASRANRLYREMGIGTELEGSMEDLERQFAEDDGD